MSPSSPPQGLGATPQPAFPSTLPRAPPPGDPRSLSSLGTGGGAHCTVSLGQWSGGAACSQRPASRTGHQAGTRSQPVGTPHSWAASRGCEAPRPHTAASCYEAPRQGVGGDRIRPLGEPPCCRRARPRNEGLACHKVPTRTPEQRTPVPQVPHLSPTQKLSEPQERAAFRQHEAGRAEVWGRRAGWWAASQSESPAQGCEAQGRGDGATFKTLLQNSEATVALASAGGGWTPQGTPQVGMESQGDGDRRVPPT